MESLEIEFTTYIHIWGCVSEVWIYNPQERKLDPRTISGYFVGYVKRSKCYLFSCPLHNTIFAELRNVKFLENDLISVSAQSMKLISEKDHSDAPSSSERWVIVHNTPQVQMGDEQPIIEILQVADDVFIDEVGQQTIAQAVVQPASQEDFDTVLRNDSPALLAHFLYLSLLIF